MILFRTSNQKRRNSLTFLANSRQQSALNAQLQKKEWIDEIFSRPVPIPKNFESRFGPEGFLKIPLYASEKRDTTFFEFGYNLFRFASPLNRGIAAVCYEIQFQGKNKPLDAGVDKNKKAILDPKSYVAAQAWLKSLGIVPEAVRYPSVRDSSGGGINFAIFERLAIGTTASTPEDLILTPRPDGSIEMESLTKGRLPIICPVC